jgi:hypothetical protein
MAIHARTCHWQKMQEGREVGRILIHAASATDDRYDLGRTFGVQADDATILERDASTT